jgi:hypothetical protein
MVAFYSRNSRLSWSTDLSPFHVLCIHAPCGMGLWLHDKVPGSRQGFVHGDGLGMGRDFDGVGVRCGDGRSEDTGTPSGNAETRPVRSGVQYRVVPRLPHFGTFTGICHSIMMRLCSAFRLC